MLNILWGAFSWVLKVLPDSHMTFSKCYLVLTKCLVIFSKCFVVLTKCFVVFSKYYLVFSTCAAPFHARTKASRACAHTYARTRAITHFITVIFPQTIHQASYPPHFQLGDGCIVGPQNYTPTVHRSTPPSAGIFTRFFRTNISVQRVCTEIFPSPAAYGTCMHLTESPRPMRTCGERLVNSLARQPFTDNMLSDSLLIRLV